MATANELFAANGEDYIVIDSDLRTMTFPASVNNIGVENDKDVHKLNFKMPRYYSGYDLSEFIVHINYVNANGDADMYYVLDPTIEENEIKFSWLVGRHACLYRGSVTFIVCLKLADGEGDVAQEFNTTLASLQVLQGLETEPTILETEHDIIEQLLLSINDTNAKIKAVLDTGLTPEQIAEFYNKSKNYDTQIAALNSSKRYYVIGSAPILAITLSNTIDGQNYLLTNTRGDAIQLTVEGSTLTIVKYNVNHTGTYNVYKSGSIIYVGIKFGSSYGTQGWSVFGSDGFDYSLSRVASIPSDATEATVITSQVESINSRSENGGINAFIEYYSNVDANLHTTAGIRYYGGGCTNIPTDYIYIITLSSSLSGDIAQLGIPVANKTAIYYRTGKRGTSQFESWRKIEATAIT